MVHGDKSTVNYTVLINRDISLKILLYTKYFAFISEKAFFDPSLLELLYFPEDQK